MTIESTKFIILRHAPTIYNREGKIQGNADTEIDPRSFADWWKRIGPKIVIKPDLVVVSGLKRTRQTANLILKRKGWQAPIISDIRLNERRWGSLEGLLEEEVIKLLASDYPEIKQVKDISEVLDSPGFRVGNAETREEVANRAKLALSDLAKKYPGKTIMIISHLGVMKFLGFDSGKVNEFTAGQSK